MGSPFAFFVMLFLAMFAIALEARPDPETTHSLKDCHTSTNNKLTGNQDFMEIKKKNPFVEDFEPRPNVSSYNDGSELSKKEKSFVKDFEPRPNVSAYSDDPKLMKDNNSFVNDFEPRPNVSAYGEDASLKEEINNDFEPRPNVSVYKD